MLYISISITLVYIRLVNAVFGVHWWKAARLQASSVGNINYRSRRLGPPFPTLIYT